jgi:hypothetical protein
MAEHTNRQDRIRRRGDAVLSQLVPFKDSISALVDAAQRCDTGCLAFIKSITDDAPLSRVVEAEADLNAALEALDTAQGRLKTTGVALDNLIRALSAEARNG